MEKKNVATTLVLILSALVFTVIGSCFMNLVYADTKITVSNPKVNVVSGVLVYDSKDENKTQIEYLKFSDSELGLKPVTGEQNSETKIPSTVTDKTGSEGLYSTIKVTAPAGLRITINNVKIDSKEKREDIEKERENLFVGVMDTEDGAKSLKEDETILITEPLAVEDKEYTILFWLDSKAADILKGAKISFDINFVV